MAEALAAIGLAAPIVQFVDFGTKVGKRLKDVVSGSDPETLGIVQNILPLHVTSLKDLGKRIEFGDVDHETQKAVSSAVEGMTALIKDLEKLLDSTFIVEKAGQSSIHLVDGEREEIEKNACRPAELSLRIGFAADR